MFFFSSRRRHTRFDCDWSSDVCSSDLDFDDFISRFYKAAKRLNYRQTGADVCFVQEIPLMLAGGFAQAAICSEWSCITLLVGRDDVDALREPALVVKWQFGTGSCVDQHGVWQMSGVDVVDKTFKVRLSRTRA